MTSVDPSDNEPFDPVSRHEVSDELDSGHDSGRSGRRPWSRRRRWLIAAAVVVALLGAATIAAVSYYDSVPMPAALDLPQQTTLYYADGETVLARVGDVDRDIIAADRFSDTATQVAVAATDPDFWTDSGSPISRRVARAEADLLGSDLATKARLWVLTRKFEDRYGKRDILALYLNLIPFGRGTYGLEAAARAYFGKSVARDAPATTQVTTAEMMVLFGMVDHPEPSLSQPGADPGFDPTRGPTAAANARARWEQLRNGLVDLHYLTRAQADALQFPTATLRPIVLPALSGMERPVGLVAQHALAELRAIPPFRGTPAGYLENGGFQIVTTVDVAVQRQVEQAADGTVAGSVLYGLSGEQAAAVVVQPGTGRVLGYFGNDHGTGADYAGWYINSDGLAVGYGAHPAGQTADVYTMATALRMGISLSSRWDSPAAKAFPAADRRVGALGPVRSRGTAPCQPACTLVDASVGLLDVPFFDLGLHLGVVHVVETERDLGIRDMWTDGEGRHRVDLTAAQIDPDVVPKFFVNEVTLGPYGMTVLDQANAMATLAGGGRRAPAHFVVAVRQVGVTVYSEKVTSVNVGLTPQQLADLSWALSHNPAGRLPGVDSATQTGLYGMANDPAAVAHAWLVGYTSRLAMAVWVGNQGAERQLTVHPGTTPAQLPAEIYRRVMVGAYRDLHLEPTRFTAPTHTGDLHPSGAL